MPKSRDTLYEWNERTSLYELDLFMAIINQLLIYRWCFELKNTCSTRNIYIYSEEKVFKIILFHAKIFPFSHEVASQRVAHLIRINSHVNMITNSQSKLIFRSRSILWLD